MQDKITKTRLEKYKNLTRKAFEIARKKIDGKKKEQAEEILNMVSCYLSDAEYFEKKKDYVNSFACLNYAHGWLDTGSRLGIFKVKDNKLFVIK